VQFYVVVIFISGLQLVAWGSNDAEVSQWPPYLK